mmetsp:Transcript_14065/g.30551  ORF Transcript_14065/g.30551 Transcript_14065/m.30551 type:complete len:651 (+) Transcript_14065:172-2124(+)|eukprot:CAMPEP_0206489038 /NCGR_PEP_ID=MMETSP0324_2-20121206/42875_1 /ASSEMBLY_ACC=CAM_ASM_000836 /TAXON_ID=2866 /ORGANISM="Crypthecodinium cohnii, Strain Seligo" /LENGTH=650 /DNA_ID=CAMNT_0053968387 /DNA_START=84 /DNA_END=2036 /DNA_ORIENTATION=+
MPAMSVGELSATVASLTSEVRRLRSDHEALLDTLKTLGVLSRVKEAGWPGNEKRPREAQSFSPPTSSQHFNLPQTRHAGNATTSAPPARVQAATSHKFLGPSSPLPGGSNGGKTRASPSQSSPGGPNNSRTMPGRASMDDLGPMRDRPGGSQGTDLYSLAKPLLEGAFGPTRLKALEQVRTALISGASPHEWRGEPSTPLIAAVKAADCDLAKMLLVAQADPHSVDEKGVTALHVAAYRGRTDLCTFMVEANADPNAADRHGQTPLFFADNVGVCRHLAAANADINVVNAKGQSALHLAARAGLSDVLSWLAGRVHPQLPELKDVHGATAAYYARHAGIKEELARARPRKATSNHRSPSSEASGSPGPPGGEGGYPPYEGRSRFAFPGNGQPMSKMESMATQLRNMTFMVEEEAPPTPPPTSPPPSSPPTPQQLRKPASPTAAAALTWTPRSGAVAGGEERDKEREREKEKSRGESKDGDLAAHVGKQQSEKVVDKENTAEKEDKGKGLWLRSHGPQLGSPRALTQLERKDRKPPSQEQAIVRIQAAARGSIVRKRYSQELQGRRTAQELELQGRSTWKRKSPPLVPDHDDEGPSEVMRQESAPRRLWKGFKDAGHEIEKSSSIEEAHPEEEGISAQASEKVEKQQSSKQ